MASSLYTALKNTYHITSIGRTDVDLTNSEHVRNWFANKQFDIVIHTAIQGGHRLVHDSSLVLDTNLKIYYNLLDNREKYNKFINIGSGAELFATDTPYGLSKHVIRQSILQRHGFYNIRAFAIFDEHELVTRFIKGNIINYINKIPMQLHQNKKMDFFYMKDFIKLIRYYIENEQIPKEIDCSYKDSVYLSDILNMINTLDTHRIPVQVNTDSQLQKNYIGNYTDLNIDYIGLRSGIKSVYEALLCNK